MAFGIIAIGHVRFEKSTFLTTVTNEPPSQTRSSNLELCHCSLRFTHLCYAVRTDFGQTRAEVKAGFNTFFPLAAVAEPNSDHFFLQMEAFGYPGYFLRGWLTFLHKAVLKGLLSSKATEWNKGEGEYKKKRLWVHLVNGIFCTFDLYNTHLIVVLLFLFRSFIPILSLYKAARNNSRFCKDFP